MRTTMIAMHGAAAAAIRPYTIAAFPREFRKSFWQSLDKRYIAIFFATLFCAYGWLLRQATVDRPKAVPVFDALQFVQKHPKILGLTMTDDVTPVVTTPLSNTATSTASRTTLSRADVRNRQRSFQEQMNQRVQQRMAQLSRLNFNLPGTAGNANDRYAFFDKTTATPGGNDLWRMPVNDDGTAYAYVPGTTQLSSHNQTVSEAGIDVTSNTVASNIAVDRTQTQLVALEVAHVESDLSASSISAADIVATISSYETAIQTVYQRSLKTQADLKGKVTLRIVFDQSGKVLSVTVMNNTTSSETFAQAVAGKIKAWRFPRSAKKNARVTVTQTFVFGR